VLITQRYYLHSKIITVVFVKINCFKNYDQQTQLLEKLIQVQNVELILEKMTSDHFYALLQQEIRTEIANTGLGEAFSEFVKRYVILYLQLRATV